MRENTKHFRSCNNKRPIRNRERGIKMWFNSNDINIQYLENSDIKEQ
jgi:hypothetical protein